MAEEADLNEGRAKGLRGLLRRAVLSVALVLCAAPAAQAIVFTPIDQGGVLDFDVGLGLPLKFENISGADGQVKAELVEGPALGSGETVAPGFLLLDRSLIVESDVQPGELRARIRINFRRAELRPRGIRVGSLRLMQFDRIRARWIRAERLIRTQGIRARFLKSTGATFNLGNFGVDAQNSVVWGVTDGPGRFAIGALLAVAEPAPIALLGAGALLLVLARRQSRTTGRAQAA